MAGAPDPLAGNEEAPGNGEGWGQEGEERGEKGLGGEGRGGDVKERKGNGYFPPNENPAATTLL